MGRYEPDGKRDHRGLVERRRARLSHRRAVADRGHERRVDGAPDRPGRAYRRLLGCHRPDRRRRAGGGHAVGGWKPDRRRRPSLGRHDRRLDRRAASAGHRGAPRAHSPSSSRRRSRTPRASPSSPPRGGASSPLRTRLAGRSSATSTTARNSGSSRSGWRYAALKRAFLPSGGRAHQVVGRRRRAGRGGGGAAGDLARDPPGHPLEGGLGPALRTLAHRSAIPVELDLTADGRLAEPIEVAAYFVASEALANAAKHSRASRIDVSLAGRGRKAAVVGRGRRSRRGRLRRRLGSRRPYGSRRSSRRIDQRREPAREGDAD